jgi:hypothetical protein
MSRELIEFVARSLDKGVERAAIDAALEKAGWPRTEIDAAIDSFAVVEFPLAVPRPKPYLSAWEVFIYLIQFISLYMSAYSLGALLFDFINRAFPDPLNDRTVGLFVADNIRWNLSLLVVSFPLFLIAFRIVHRAVAGDPTKRASRPRKWLTYLTLFIAALALIGDVSSLVDNVLGGEFTARFLLKIATVAVLAGGIFVFFLTDMKRDEAA